MLCDMFRSLVYCVQLTTFDMDANFKTLCSLIDGTSTLAQRLSGDVLDSFSKQQAEAVSAALGKSKQLSFDEAAIVIDKVRDISCWSATQKEDLLKIVSARAVAQVDNIASSPIASRMVLQDFTALPSYISPSMWKVLQQSSYPKNARLELVAKFASQLGLVSPTELTCATIMAIVNLAAKEGLQASQADLHAEFRVSKAFVKKQLCEHPEARKFFLQSLPHDVNIFLQSARGKIIFETELPGECPFSAEALSAYARSIPLRSSNMSSHQAFLPFKRSTGPPVAPWNWSFGQQQQGMFFPGASSSVPIMQQPYASPAQFQSLAAVGPLQLLPTAQTQTPLALTDAPKETIPLLALESKDALAKSVSKSPMDALFALKDKAEASKKESDDAKEAETEAHLDSGPKKLTKSGKKPIVKPAKRKSTTKGSSKLPKSQAGASKVASKKKVSKPAKPSASKSGGHKKVKTQPPVIDMNDMTLRKKLRPNGCSKCRWKTCCTPSCFRSKSL